MMTQRAHTAGCCKASLPPSRYGRTEPPANSKVEVNGIPLNGPGVSDEVVTFMAKGGFGGRVRDEVKAVEVNE